jgi:transposase
MRFAGIDRGGERHAIAVVNEDGAVLTKPTFFTEDADGYRRLRELLDDSDDCLVAMEATGHIHIGTICSRFWWAKALSAKGRH